ncbi:hypothetical protein [Methanothrix soehngenii]|uniref:nicotinate-nucleotide diphosphorylase n=1 Tax=Methanothrix soehngenii TaxID=2223 RepID=UPI00300D3FBB
MLRSELERFIGEDLGEWDDSSTLIPELTACGIIIAKEDCIISGLAEAVEIFQYFGLKSELLFDDGEFVPAMSTVLEVVGSARKILQSERLVLNFMARMSGISTLTRECVLLAGGGASGSHAQDHPRISIIREESGLSWRRRHP